MKYRIAGFFCLMFLSVTAISQQKLALIVAVGEYPPESRLRPIASVNDVKFIKAALLKNGFEEKNIDTLINEKATKKNIIDRLNELSAKANQDDIVMIHFGCHGQQIRDQKTPELGKDEDDGYDEALLPYDAKGFYNPVKYRGENHLRDDELNVLLTDIRKKIGRDGSLLVLIDACHSGTGTRADDFPSSRGEPVPFPDPENPYDPSAISDINEKGTFFDYNSDSVSNMVVISGSGPHQENKQMLVNYEEVGSLSYSFYKAMNELPEAADYGLMFQKIKTYIRFVIPDQYPVIEGKTNQLVFSGKYNSVEKRNYLSVGHKGSSQAVIDNVFSVNIGLMDNLTEGTEGTIYPIGKTEPIARAVIKKSGHFFSIGVSDKPLSPSEAYEIRFDKENYGDLRASFSFKKTESKNTVLEKSIKDFLSAYSFVSFAEPADFQFEQEVIESEKRITLKDRNNKVLWVRELSEQDSLKVEDMQRLIRRIKNTLRIRYLRTMPDGGELSKKILAEIIPEKGIDGKEVMLNPGEIYTLKIFNNSNQKLFYTVLDIYPDDRVEILYPYKGKAPADYSIEKKNFVEKKLRVSRNSPPGTEFLKIIVSKEPMEQIWEVFEQSSTRSNLRSFETMLNDLFSNTENESGTRADIAAINAEEIGTVTVHFIVNNN